MTLGFLAIGMMSAKAHFPRASTGWHLLDLLILVGCLSASFALVAGLPHGSRWGRAMAWPLMAWAFIGLRRWLR